MLAYPYYYTQSDYPALHWAIIGITVAVVALTAWVIIATRLKNRRR